jgi:tol-pal system protein YbgF
MWSDMKNSTSHKGVEVSHKLGKAESSRAPEVAVVLLILGLVAAAGCGPTKVEMKETIDRLQDHIARLQSERTNIEARSNAMDDQLVVLGKKLDRCQEGTRPLLEVVRLTPSDEEETPAESEEEVPPEATKIDLSATRPVLTLDQRSVRRVAVGSGAGSLPGGSQPSFSDLGPDNLGVVAADEAKVPGGPMEDFHAAYRAFSNRRHQEALEGFAAFVRDHPEHGYADNAIFWRGESYLALGKFFKAIGEYERLLRRYPRSEKVPSGFYRIGFAYDQLRDREKALEYYFKVVDKHPTSDAARRASKRVSAIEGKDRKAGRPMPTSAKR